MATVDRVLNARLPVRHTTRQLVDQAIRELEQQEAQIGLAGRKFMIDVIVEAPTRFLKMAEAAMLRVAPVFGSAVFRARYTNASNIPDDNLMAIAEKVVRRGTDGVLMIVRDTEGSRAAIKQLSDANIPVVTMASDVRDCKRIAYVGMDNVAAGKAAALLMKRYVKDEADCILVAMRNPDFASERMRLLGFRDELSNLCPKVNLDLIETCRNAARTIDAQIEAASRTKARIRGIYSIDGSNKSILASLRDLGNFPEIFIAHDLDDDNEELLRHRMIDFVLHHEMEGDMRDACFAIMNFHGFRTSRNRTFSNRMQILTRHNV